MSYHLYFHCQDFLLQVSEMLLRVNKDVFHKHRCFKDKHVTRPQTVKLHRVHPHVPESLGLLFWRKVMYFLTNVISVSSEIHLLLGKVG